MGGIHGGDIYRNKVNMDFSVNINPLGIPDEVKKVLKGAADRCLEYPDMEASELKSAVSNMLGIPGEYLIFGNGASEIFMGIVHALKPEKTLIPVPSFYGYEYTTEAASSDIVYFPLKEENEFLPDEDLLEALTEDIDMLWFANPNNPTGKRVETEYLKKLFQVCREKNIYVVLDECFIEFCGSEYSMLPDMEDYAHVLIVRAFTKIYAIPGVRLGYLVCSNQTLSDRIRKQLPEWNLSVFAQAAGVACTGQRAYVEKALDYVKKERKFLIDGLKKFGFRVYDSDTNFILIYSERPLYEMLLQRGILVRDCANFKGLSKGFYRIAVKQRKDNEKLLEAIGDCLG